MAGVDFNVKRHVEAHGGVTITVGEWTITAQPHPTGVWAQTRADEPPQREDPWIVRHSAAPAQETWYASKDDAVRAADRERRWCVGLLLRGVTEWCPPPPPQAI